MVDPYSRHLHTSQILIFAFPVDGAFRRLSNALLANTRATTNEDLSCDSDAKKGFIIVTSSNCLVKCQNVKMSKMSKC